MAGDAGGKEEVWIFKIYDMNKDYNAFLVAITAAVVAYFDTTYTFLIALFIGFAMNVVAGLRADDVRFVMTRFPYVKMLNYSGHKLKDSLMELFLITSITYLLKLMIDLFKHNDKSEYAVQILLAVAVYYYFTNSLKNLVKVYDSRWLLFLYYLISFQFREMLPAVVGDAMDKADKEIKKEKEE